MHGSHSSLAAFCFSVVTLPLVMALAPATASAADADGPSAKPTKTAKAPTTAKAPSKASTRINRTARVSKTHGCSKDPVEVIAGSDSANITLTTCRGDAVPAGVDVLSILARPGGTPRPKGPLSASASSKTHANDVAPGIRRLDARLAERLETVVDHFRKDGHLPRVQLVSGYRPRSVASYHAKGRALDFRLEGVKNEELVAFCKTLSDTGCGYYPNSLFVHMDVRDPGTGHVAWIDVSRPGEAPKYVTAWPAPSADADAKLPALPNEEHTATTPADAPKHPKQGDTSRLL